MQTSARRSRRMLGLVIVVAAALLASSSPAAAAAWEANYAKRVKPLTYLCDYSLDAGYGGNQISPHYTACFHDDGDYLVVLDARADGRAAVMKWEYKKKRGAKVSRKGVCIYTGGSKARRNKGVCNKDIPETGVLRFSAGVRVKTGTSLAGMKFGSPVCLAMKGSKNKLADGNCIFW